jgi:hypothetical protein
MKRWCWLPVFAAVVLVGPAMCGQAAGDLDKSYASLKQAEANKDAAQVKKLAVETMALAKQSEAAAGEETGSASKQQVEYARSIELHCEYAVFVAAMQSPPAVMVDLVSTLQGMNPKSRYLDEAYGPYLVALTKTGASAKVPEVASKGLANFPDNEDLLLVMANQSLTANQTDRALTYASRLVAVLGRHPRPEGMPAAEWDRKCSEALARGNWIVGVISGAKEKYVDADKHLRAALPMIKDDPAMNGPALFYLGVANYQLGKMTLNKARVLEGANFSQQAAAVPGPLAQQAWRNAQIMKTEAGKMR